jgi:dienelactone hydrolase
VKFISRIQRQHIATDAFVGTLFVPDNQEQAPGVIVLPGSDGGIPKAIAQRIASYGYTTLALGYFGVKGLPHYLENIHLEYFQKAIEYLRSLPQVKKDSVALVGYSRGGELALSLGAFFPKMINGVIAFVPCSVVCGGFPHINRPTWLLNNRPIVPFLNGLMSRDETLTEAEDLLLACKKGVIPYHSNTAEDPYEVVDLFLARHERQKPIAAATIPVENLDCPLLIISGEQDKIWPSALYAKLIMDRLTQKGSKIARKSLVYPHAGHGIIAPYEGSIYHRVGKFWCTLGGTPDGNKQANESAWQEVVQFLDDLKEK